MFILRPSTLLVINTPLPLFSSSLLHLPISPLHPSSSSFSIFHFHPSITITITITIFFSSPLPCHCSLFTPPLPLPSSAGSHITVVLGSSSPEGEAKTSPCHLFDLSGFLFVCHLSPAFCSPVPGQPGAGWEVKRGTSSSFILCNVFCHLPCHLFYHLFCHLLCHFPSVGSHLIVVLGSSNPSG